MNPKVTSALLLVLAFTALAYSSPVEDSELGGGQFLDSASIEDNFADATEASSSSSAAATNSNVVKRGVSAFNLGAGTGGAGKGYIFGQGGIGLGGAHLSGGWGFDAHHHGNHHGNHHYHHQPKGWGGKGHGTVVYHIDNHSSNKGSGWGGWGNDYKTGYSYTAGGWGGHHQQQQKGWGGHY